MLFTSARIGLRQRSCGNVKICSQDDTPKRWSATAYNRIATLCCHMIIVQGSRFIKVSPM